ncbi:MAG: hypothetical protein MJZ76_04645 [Bacteroidales bacterium]|nr:hypothetical protein [Bacteroidales bacterium]
MATLLLLGLYFAIQSYRYSKSDFVEGYLFYDEQVQPDFIGDVPMSICYFVGNESFEVPVYEYYEKGNQVVTVRYPEDNPKKGEIFSFVRFWCVPALWLLLPLMLIGALLLTVFKPYDMVEIQFANKNKSIK